MIRQLNSNAIVLLYAHVDIIYLFYGYLYTLVTILTLLCPSLEMFGEGNTAERRNQVLRCDACSAAFL